jgi:hypothetical protein
MTESGNQFANLRIEIDNDLIEPDDAKMVCSDTEQPSLSDEPSSGKTDIPIVVKFTPIDSLETL